VASRREPGVETDPELRDDVCSRARVGDELTEHLRGAAAFDRKDPAAFEAKGDGLVDETVDRVRNRQIGDKHAVGAVLQRRDEHLPTREVGARARLERERIAEPRATLDAKQHVGAGGSADADLLRALELGQQPPRRRLELRLRLGELAFEKLGGDECEIDLTAAVPGHRLEHLEARARLRADRVLREEVAERRLPCGGEHARRRVRERPVAAGPELEPRSPARLPDGVGERRALLDKRLVDHHEHALAGLGPSGVDQVSAPAGRFAHGAHPRKGPATSPGRSIPRRSRRAPSSRAAPAPSARRSHHGRPRGRRFGEARRRRSRRTPRRSHNGRRDG
jgi:hypothetical protein